MKRMKHIFLVSILLFGLAGGVMTGCISKSNDSQIWNEEIQSEKAAMEHEGFVYKQKKTKLEYDGEQIEAELKHVDFIIRPSGDSSYYLEYDIKSRKEENPLSVQVQNGILGLKEEAAEEAAYYSGISVDGFSGKLKEKKEDYTSVLTLYIPTDKKIHTFSVNMGTGDMKAQNFYMETADIMMEEGDLELSEGTIQSGKIFVTDGDVEGSKIDFTGNVQIQTDDGDIELCMDSSCRNTLSIFADTEMDIEVSEKLEGELKDRGEMTVYEKIVDGASNRLSILSEFGDIAIDIE